MNIVCTYAPQLGCEEPKERVLTGIRWGNWRIVRSKAIDIVSDINEHVGKNKLNDGRVHEEHGFREEMRLNKLTIVHTYFFKERRALNNI